MSPTSVSQSDHLQTALMCAKEGFPVFPVAEGGFPLTKGGAKDATTNVAQIKAWWAKWPSAHIGTVFSEDLAQASSRPSQPTRGQQEAGVSSIETLFIRSISSFCK